MNYVIGPLLFAALAVSIYYRVKNEAGLHQVQQLLQDAFNKKNLLPLLLLFMLMLCNWGIEARKWQVLANRVQPVSYFRAYQAVLSGLSFSLFVPNGIGDYAGRLLYMQEGNRLRSLTLTFTGSMAQLIVTLTFGLAAMLYLKNTAWLTADAFNGLSVFWINSIITMIAIGTLMILFVYFKMSWLTKTIEKVPFIYKYRFMLEKLEDISRSDLTRILSLSITRYAVFIVQYILVLHLFNVEIPLTDAVCTVCVMFLVLAILPTIPVADLGMRGEAGLQLFGILTANTLGIIATTSAIWLINIIIPAVAGSLFITGIKFFRNR